MTSARGYFKVCICRILGCLFQKKKYKSKAILANDTDPATLLPQFGKKERILWISLIFRAFVYFELNLKQKVFTT